MARRRRLGVCSATKVGWCRMGSCGWKWYQYEARYVCIMCRLRTCRLSSKSPVIKESLRLTTAEYAASLNRVDIRRSRSCRLFGDRMACCGGGGEEDAGEKEVVEGRSKRLVTLIGCWVSTWLNTPLKDGSLRKNGFGTCAESR